METTYVKVEGYAKATKASLGVSNAQIVSVSFYSHATGNFRLAIYTDSGGPSSKQWESLSTAANASQWNVVNISAGTPTSLTLTSGTYWLAWQWDSANAGPSYTSAASTGNYIAQAYGAFPTTWGTGTGTAEEWSIYVTYSTVTAGAITPTAPTIDSGQVVSLVSNPSGGNTPYTYQWYTGAGCTSPVSGATLSYYYAPPTVTTTYYYKVTDSTSASACSAGDVVTVNSALVVGGITPIQPKINSGQSVTLTANPSGGTAAYSYQWYTGSVCTSAVSGATSSTYSASPTTTTTYYYKVTDSAYAPVSACSAGDAVVVNSALAAGAITPSAPTIDSGQVVSLVSHPSGGSTPYTYQWYTGAGCTSPVSGATSNTYSASPTTTTTYYYQVTDSSYAPVSVCSAGDVVTVNSALVAGGITPSAPTIDSGQSVTLTANPSGGTSPYTYKWYSGSSCGTLLSGATSSTYTTPTLTSGTYYCVAVTDAAYVHVTKTSTADLVTVNKASPTISTALSPASPITAGVSVHDSATLTGGSGASGQVTYNYYFGDVCGGSATIVSMVTVTGGFVPNSTSQQFNTVGSFSWNAVYSGDGNNNGASSACEPLTVSSAALDHFTFDTISSPQTAGEAFAITITAVDLYGNNVTGYVGTNTLNDLTGTISPTSTIAFMGGVWAGSVAITAPRVGDTITTTGGSPTKSGTSVLFDVNPGTLDHFTFSTISSPQTAGTAFSITITAKDLYGNTVASYADANTLTALSGTIAPATTTAFVGGVLLGFSVTLDTARTGMTISTNGGGKSGVSNGFTVDAQTATITITSTVTGSGFVKVDSVAYATPHGFTWIVGESHLLEALSPISGGAGTQYAWQSWSDSGDQVRNYTTPSSATTVTANYVLQYYINVTSLYGNPTASGWTTSGQDYQTSVTSPDGDYWCDGYRIDNGTLTAGTNYTFTNVHAPHEVEYVWSLNTVTITVTSSPTVAGLVKVDSVAYATPHDFSWIVGAQHALEALSPVSGGAGVQYVWMSWSDIGVQVHDYTTPGSAATVTANYAPQYYVTVTSLHGNPTSSGWADSGQDYQTGVTSPDGDYRCDGYSVDAGSLQPGTSYNFTSVQAPHEVEYLWSLNTVAITVTSNSTGSGFVKVDNVAYITPHDFSWTVGAHHALEALSPVSGGTGTQYAWVSWSDGEAQSHDYVVPGVAQTITTMLTTQHYVNVTSLQGNPTSSGWVNSGQDYQTSVTSPDGVYMCTGYRVDNGTPQAGTSYTFTNIQAPHTIEYLWSLNTITVTVTSSPTGAGLVKVDSVAYATPHDFSWKVGTLHTLEAISPVSGGAVTQYVWMTWSDSGNQTHLVTVPGAPATFTANYQTQYLLTMEVSPSGAGSTTPITGWQTSGTSIAISASVNPTYAFQSWSGSGSGNYSGADNPASITMSGAITEVASFTLSGLGPVTMTVNYVIVGDGSPTVPVFNYVQGGASMHSSLNLTATPVLCDGGSAWSVTPNPIPGSASEQWYANPTILSGTASTRTIAFSFQHQYYLTMLASPSGSSTALIPGSGWQTAGASATIRVTPKPGYQFQSWTGTGSGSYSGSGNPVSIAMNEAITETATLTSTGPPPAGSQCQFAGTASIVEGTRVFSVAADSTPSLQQLLLPLSLVLPASGLVANRRTRKDLKGLLLGGRHGGLSGLTSVIVLVVLVASAVIGVAVYYYNISSGAGSQSNMIFSGSVIKVNSSTDTGTVYLKMYNAGSSSVRIMSINVTAESGDFNIDFSSGTYGMVSAPGCNCTISSGSGVGMGGSIGDGFLSLPAGTTTSMMIVFNSGITSYFEPGTRYQAMVVPVQAAEMPFSIPSEGGQ